jgi:hypothetical protein
MLGEPLARPSSRRDQPLHHVRRHQRPEHVSGGVDRPRSREQPLRVQSFGHHAGALPLAFDGPVAMPGGIRVLPPYPVDLAVYGEETWRIPGQVTRPLVEGGERVRRRPHDAQRLGEALLLGHVVEQRGHQLRPRREVQVDGPPGDPGAFRHGRHAQRLEARFFQQFAHRGQQRLTGAQAAGVAWVVACLQRPFT